MADLPLIITAAGRAALVNAAHDGTAPVTIATVGVSPTAITATTATATLPGEIKRIATISGDVVAPDTIHLVVRDATTSAYSVRALALYLADGTLFAAYGQPGIILEKSALSLLLLALDVRFADVAATSLTFGDANFLNPPATETVQGVIELASQVEATAGTDDVRALTPKKAKSAFASWIDDRFGAGAPSTFVKTLLTAASAAVFRTTLGLKNAALKDEGSGNGLDADTVDGVHAASFARLSGADFVGALTRSGSTVWHAANDGAGSGLDAGLLAGQLPGYYTDITTRLGYTPIRQGTGAGQVANMVAIGWDGSGLRAQVDATDLGRFAFQSSLTDVWRSSNDGSGSGLDADLLDGYQAAAFLRNAVNTWHASADGIGRIHFGNGGATALRIKDTILFQNSAGTNVANIDEAGSLTTAGNVRGYNLTTATGAATGALFFGSNNAHFLQYDGANWVLRGGGTLFVDNASGSLGQAWHSLNDGAGSGMDADLLDGKQGSEYASVTGQIFTGDIGREVGFRMTLSGGNPGILFTADATSSVFYNRTSKYYTFYIDGRAVFDVDPNGNARFRGTVTPNVAF